MVNRVGYKGSFLDGAYHTRLDTLDYHPKSLANNINTAARATLSGIYALTGIGSSIDINEPWSSNFIDW